MKICFITDAWLPIWGGGQVHVLNLSKTIVKNYGADIDILTPDLKGKEKILEEKLPSHIRIIPVGPRFTFPNFLGRILFTISVLVKLLFSSYDIYHFHSLTFIPFIFLIKLTHPRSKTAFTLHGQGDHILGIGRIGQKISFSRLANFFMYNFPVDIKFTSAKSSINDKNTDRFVVTGNGIDIPEVIKNTKSTKKVNILSIARFDPIKGIPNLLNAFNKLLNDFPQAHLTLVGHGSEEHEIVNEIQNLKIEKKVTLKKLFKQEALNEYRDANVFVLPSLSEGFPLVVLEAMAYKVPIVATKVGDIPEILENGRLGELVEKNDSDALYLAIKKVISRDNLKTINAAYLKVKKYYNWNQVASKIYAEYI